MALINEEKIVALDAPGMSMAWYADTESLMQAVENKDIEIGIDFPDGFAAGAAAG